MRVKIEASEGMTLTNGKTHGKIVFLGEHDSPDNWQEIPETELIEENTLV